MASLYSYALTSVSDVKESLGIASSDTSKDNLITRKINAATDMIENYCSRRFASTTYTNEVYNGEDYSTTLTLKQYPVTTISSLQIRDALTNDEQWETVSTEFYFLESDRGIIDFLGTFSGGYQRWRVSYVAGYTTIPSDLAEACASLAGYLVVHDPTTFNVQDKQEGQRRLRFETQNSQLSLFQQIGILETLDSYAKGDTLISGRP